MGKPLDGVEDALRSWASDAGCRLVILFGSWVRDGANQPRDVDSFPRAIETASSGRGISVFCRVTSPKRSPSRRG